MIHNLAIIGFGNVGQGLVELLVSRADTLWAEQGFEARITAVSDVQKGSLYHPEGLDSTLLLQTVTQTGSLAAYPDTPGQIRGWDSLTTITESNAQVVIETAWTDLQTGQPAIDHMRTAFQTGKHVVTTNKGPVALAYRELSDLARRQGVFWGIEGTVMSGTPALRLAEIGLACSGIREIRGILNGTTNFILARMEAGESYQDALAEAQRLGYAEADPTADVEGHDTLGKLLILAAVLMGTPLTPSDVALQGITALSAVDLQQAVDQGAHWKLIGHLRRQDGHLVASVGPQMLLDTHPLAGVTGATNAITYSTDVLSDVTLIGPGAGKKETGYAVLSDLLAIHRQVAG